MYSLSIVCKWNVSIDACSLLTGLAIDYIVKYNNKKREKKWSNILNQILHVPWWHEFCPGVIICDWHFFLFFFLFCFWKWMRKLRIFYFAYSQSHSSRSDHGGQEFWYFLRVECILLKLQNLASLGAEFVPRSLLQRFFFCPKAFAEICIVFWEVHQYSSTEPWLYQPMVWTRFCLWKNKNQRELRTLVALKKKKKKRKNGRNTVHSQPRPNNVYSTD